MDLEGKVDDLNRVGHSGTEAARRGEDNTLHNLF
jgi:hypothetical protein